MQKGIQEISVDYDRIAKWVVNLAVQVADGKVSVPDALNNIAGMTQGMSEESRQAIHHRFLRMIGREHQ